MRVEFLKPDIRKADIDRMIQSIKSGWLVRGDHTREFETKLGAFLGNRAHMTSSCTAALEMSLILAGIKEGDEVITTPLSWVATSNVILYRGAKVVFADVDPQTGLIDINEVRKKITPRTKAVIVVHLYGQMVDMKAFASLGIPIIEDAAHALESERDGIRPGQLGFSACFSFHAAKNITCGQGGAIVTRDIERCELLTRDGVRNTDGKRIMHELGYKFDLTDFQAALLIGQLDRIESTHARRCEVFRRYEDAFAGKLAFPRMTGKHACHMFVVRVDPARRDAIRTALADQGIQTSIHYTPIHLEPFYRTFVTASLPHAEAFGTGVITLPSYALTRPQQKHVIRQVLELSGC